MNKLKSILLIIALCFTLLSCGNKTAENTVAEQETHDELHQESLGTLELNGGEKWVVNDEMKPYVLKGNELAERFIKENKSDYTTLAKNLKEQNNQLIESCTMTGKSHEELHKWLYPHLELVDELEKATDENEAQNIIRQLLDSYRVYSEYFH